MKKFGIILSVMLAIIILFMLLLDKPVFLLFRGFGGEWINIISNISSFKFWILSTALVFGATGGIRIIRRWLKLDIPFYQIIARVNIMSLWVFLSVALAGAVGGALKIIIGRARPVLWEGLGQTGFSPMSTSWVYNSMPSGHTLATVAALVSIGMMFPRYKFYLWAAAALAGFARIAGGAHWPSDVIAGAVIGAAAAMAISYFFKLVAILMKLKKMDRDMGKN